MNQPDAGDMPKPYTWPARWLHWITVLLVVLLIATGTVMTYRADDLKIFDATTNALYSSHKLLGVGLLALVVVRFAYRLMRGAPPDPPTLPRLQKVAAHGVHWALYGLLLATPIVGWIGISMFPALDVFGIVKLPALVGPDRKTSEQVFELHETLGDVLLALVALHVAAALVHHFVLRDGVLYRMWPTRKVR